MTELDATVIVVDEDAGERGRLTEYLRRIGLRALGVYLPTDAVAVMDGVSFDAVVVRCGRAGAEAAALGVLRHRAVVVEVTPAMSAAQAAAHLIGALTARRERVN